MCSMKQAISSISFLLFAVAILSCAGCGGGGSGSPSGGGSGPRDSRAVLFDTIAAKFASFDGANPEQENQQMLAFLKTRTEFEETGLSEAGGVWGRRRCRGLCVDGLSKYG